MSNTDLIRETQPSSLPRRPRALITLRTSDLTDTFDGDGSSRVESSTPYLMLAAEQSMRTHVTTEMNIEETPLDLAESRECDSIRLLVNVCHCG